ncbi:MAG: pyrroline-5-carboxylate reductase dimerization domain-containing protein, partial [Naasia sp.]
VFETVGTVHEVPEDQIDALTSISGSGPAYVFYLIEKLTEAGIARGLDPALAGALAAETFAGASALLAETDLDPAELRRRVTSPGGTTARAIEVFDDRGVGEIIDVATAAAAARAAEMAATARP